MCVFQERFLEISTPKYLADGTASKRTRADSTGLG